jgi:hypothetical protein
MLRGLVDPERPLTLAGLDVGFSPRKRTAGLARLAGGKCSFSCCFGREAEAELARYGIYDLIAIDGPILPEGCKNLMMVRPVERLFFQRAISETVQAEHVACSGHRNKPP